MDRLVEAIEGGDLSAVKRLVKEGLNPASHSNFAIKLAADTGRAKIVAFLLSDPRVDPEVDSNYPLRMATSFGYTKVVALLLADRRVNAMSRHNESLREAIAGGHTDVVALLLPHLDPAADDDIAIREAAELGHVEIVALLLQDPRVDPAAADNQAIKKAALYASHDSKPHEAIVAMLFHDSRVRAQPLPAPDLDSRDPLARELAKIVDMNVRASRMVHKLLGRAQSTLKEYALVSEVLKYEPRTIKRRR